MMNDPQLFDPNYQGSILRDPQHMSYLRADARRQLDFFRTSLRGDGGFDTLNWDGSAMPRGPQELHTTTRLVHSYALGKMVGDENADGIIDAGMAYLLNMHRDRVHGGYFWSVTDEGTADGTKLAYGHVFVLLAAASAKQVGHPNADRLLDDISGIIDDHYWDEDHGRLKEEYNRDWSPFSSYRGMNANMHGVEALLAAFEATGEAEYLNRAGRILDFFVGQIAPEHGWRLPEHYTGNWDVDPEYSGNPMFRPAGSTPGHSFELGRLALQHWDLSGRPAGEALKNARKLIEQADKDAWAADGGFAYTLDMNGNVAIDDRYWWPVAEAIGAYATLLKIDPKDSDTARYREIWAFAKNHLIDSENGGWFPELNTDGLHVERQFSGKPDIYHSLQAVLFPITPGISDFCKNAGDIYC